MSEENKKSFRVLVNEVSKVEPSDVVVANITSEDFNAYEKGELKLSWKDQ